MGAWLRRIETICILLLTVLVALFVKDIDIGARL
jgi:hypothetical protein